MTNMKKGLKLDNASLLFTAMNHPSTNVYHVGASLKDKVDALALEQALNDIAKRFPYFFVRLKKKLCWYLLVPSDGVPKPVFFNGTINEDIPKNSKHLFRVVYGEKSIAVEFYHCLGDANSCLTFLNTLLLRYFELLGKKIKDISSVMHYNEVPDAGEYFDDYENIFKRDFKEKKHKYVVQKEKAFYVKGDGSNTVTRTFYDFSSKELYEKVKSLGEKYTVHNLLVGAVLKALLEVSLADKCNKNIKLETAVNFRSMFSSNSMRNFVGIILINLPQEEQTFEQLVEKSFIAQKEEFTYDKMLAFTKNNVLSGKMTKYIPLCIKNTVLRNLQSFIIDKASTMPMSNLGRIKTPKEYEELIDSYKFVLGAPMQKAYSIGVIGFKDQTTLSFTRICFDPILESAFDKVLKDAGISINKTIL